MHLFSPVSQSAINLVSEVVTGIIAAGKSLITRIFGCHALYQSFENRIRRLTAEAWLALSMGGGIGLEKESLRVSHDGSIAQTPHPMALGSALTNPYIPTDYTEALAELITPPMQDGGEALAFLRDVQKFVYDNLENEILCATRMPCVLAGVKNIHIARYGNSKAG